MMRRRVCCLAVLVLAAAGLVGGALGQQDEIEGVFPQMGTGHKELEDEAVLKGLEAAVQAADKGAFARAGATAPALLAYMAPLSRGVRTTAVSNTVCFDGNHGTISRGVCLQTETAYCLGLRQSR
jgi:hypothetical protein